MSATEDSPQQSGTRYIRISGTFSGTITTNQAGTTVSFNASNSYDIRIQAIDAFEELNIDREIGTGDIFMWKRTA